MIKKIGIIINRMLIVAFILIFPVQWTYLFYNRIQLTTKSFDKLYEFNNEMKKLTPLDGKTFKDKEELKYNAYKLVNPNYFDKNYFLDSYLFNNRVGYQYYPNITELKKAGIEDSRLSSLLNTNYYDFDSLLNIIKALSNQKDFPVYNYYINSKYYNLYSIYSISDVIISDKDIRALKVIQNISYKSTEEFEQAIKEVLGLEKFKKYNSLIITVADRTTQWQKNMLYIFIGLFLFLIIARITVGILLNEFKKKEADNEIEDNINKAKLEIAEKPTEITPVWELANYTLQKYYNKNLSQVNSIYKLSITVMIMGFLLILSILIASIFFKVDVKLDSIGIIAGIITEFIGATFLFIYKSTIKQALQHSNSLEDINKVGMAIKIIELIEITELNKSKIEDAKLGIAKELITTKIMHT